MSARTLFSIVESPAHPDFSRLYKRLEIREVRLASMRKAISALKGDTPDYVVAEFFYGYGNNYAGANLGNLDVFLRSLPKYAPDTKVIAMVAKPELKYAEQLGEMLPLFAILQQPVRDDSMRRVLSEALE